MKSDVVTKGMQSAPHRSLFNALGMTKEELSRPLVGIVSSYNEIVPGHMNIDKIVDAVKMGVAMAGGTPIVFPAIAVCDGIAMGHIGMKYSLVTRDLIADSTECMATAHQFDALVMVPNCDKNVPGLLMAAARLNIPTVFVSGGPMMAGHVGGEKRSLSSMFEAVGSYAAGTMTEEQVDEFVNKVCPTCGSCSGMYTANSMNCLTEVLGMGLQGNGTIPAVYSERLRLAKHAGMKVMEMLEKNIRPRDIMTEKAFLNALTVDMALGCSTNSMLHLPAIAHEAGVELNVDIANEIAKAMGKELEIQNMTFDGALLAVQQGVVDFAAAGISVTPERQEEMDFTIEYATSRQVVVVKKDAGKIASVEDVKEGTVVGVQTGTTADFYCGDEGCEVKQYNKYAEAAMELKNDKIDCIVMDSLPGEQLVAANDDLEILEGELFTDKYAIAVKKGNTELLDQMNEVLQKLVDEGKVDEFTINHTTK